MRVVMLTVGPRGDGDRGGVDDASDGGGGQTVFFGGYRIGSTCEVTI